jgi:hypothetical protein
MTRTSSQPEIVIFAVSSCVSCCVMLCAALGGPLPASITQLRSLEALSLESNAFNGSLPPNLCRDMTALRVRVVLVGEAAGGVCVGGYFPA